MTSAVQLPKTMGMHTKKFLKKGKVKPKNKIKNQIVLHCMVNTWIETNKKLVVVQLHTSSISAIMRARSFIPLR